MCLDIILKQCFMTNISKVKCDWIKIQWKDFKLNVIGLN